MLNSLRDGQINYGTTNCPSAHVPPHNVVAPIHQNSLHSTEPSTPVVYPWNSNPRLEHLYGFHSRYYNLDFPSPYPPATNQYVPPNIYGQNVSQCCQPCCRLRSQNIPKPSPPQVLYNPIRPVQQVNRSYKSKKTLKTSCSEQFLPYIANDLPGKYDTQNVYQQKYGSSYLNNTNYCPPANNLWIPPAANPTWPTDRLRPAVGRHSNVTSHDISREKSYQRLQHYQTNPYSNPTSSTHHRPYNYIPPIPDVQNYRPPVYHNSIKNTTPEYVSQDHNSRLPIQSQINPSPASLQHYYNAQPVPYSDVQRPNESFKPLEGTPQNSSKSNLNVREFLANWDEGEEEVSEKPSETTTPIVVLDCMTLEGEALTKIQEKLNVVSYENLEKVLKENNNPLVINTESSEIDSINNKVKPPSKLNFEPIDYTKRETGIIKPFINEKKRPLTTNTHPDKNYSVNFDGMVAWYGKKNTDISSTDLIERLADRIFNLSKSQENDGVSFGTAAYTGQITQTNRSIESSVKDSSKYLQNQLMYGLPQHSEKCIEPSVINKIDCNNGSISRINSSILSDNKKESTIKSNNINSSCIVENTTKKCVNVTNEETASWNLGQRTQEQHLNMSMYDQSVIIKPLDFSSLTDETKCNPFVFEKNTSNGNKSNNSIDDQFHKVLNENSNYNTTVSNNQQIDSTNRNFPVIVSPNVHRQEYNGLHESVIQRTGCDKNKHDKVPTQTDFESMNWNISNDIDKIMKNTNMTMEPSCLYDRNNYNILDSINSDKNVSTQWKDNVPCVDLTVNSKTNNNHDSFFDSWNFIENYENHSNKKLINPHSTNNEVHNPLFSNQISPLEESHHKQNSSGKIENETLIPIKDMPKDISSNNTRSQDVFNLNNRIPDFSDGFELPVIHEPPDYMQFKKASNDNERRTDGSIFEHLNETKCIRTVNEMTNTKIEQNKSDIVGLPSFKEKEPLAPMLVPPKLNIVKPILRDPSQLYTVIKQKLKYDNTCIDNDSAVSNKTGNTLRGNHLIHFNVDDLKSKYNSVQLNQFDVWSEKFELKSNSNNSSNAVMQCDVEITQFKSNPENRNALIPKPNSNEDYQEKNEKLSGNTNCNLTIDKMNVIENEKMNSNDFLNCLESTKTDDQKYRDTLDEFETSFGFDIHCNNETNKSFHEDIVDKCLEERIKDQIGEHNINSSDSNTTPNTNISSNSSQLPFQCDFQSSYLIKNYFDENKNKTIIFDKKNINNDEKSSKTPFDYHNEMEHNFEIQNNKNLHVSQNSEKISDYNVLNTVNCSTRQIQNDNEKNNLNFINQAEFKPSFETNHKNSNSNDLSSLVKNNENYLNNQNQKYKFENSEKSILELADSKVIIGNNKLSDDNRVCKLSQSDSSIHKLSNIQIHSSAHFELNINNSNIFETNSNTTSAKSKTETIKNLELQNTKNIYGIDNNNCTIYQTQNLQKVNEFDFETRIIQNFEMECSNSNVQDSSNLKKVSTCENQMKTKYSLEINDEKNSQQVTHFKSTPSIHETHYIQKTSDLDRNGIKQLDNVIEAENTNQESKIDHTFEINCSIGSIQQEDTAKIHQNCNIQNKNAEEINHNTCTHANSNINNNTEVENIFKNLYGNLTSINTRKFDTNISDQCGQNYNEFDVSKNIENQNLKTNDTIIVDEECKKTKTNKFYDDTDETFEESNTVLFQELVNNSTSNLTPTLLEQKTILEKKLTSAECEFEKLNEHTSNKNENILDISNINAVHENTKPFEEQQIDDFKQNKIELMNQNNMHTLKNLTVDIVQGSMMKKMFENTKSDLLNAVENTDILRYNEHNQNISYRSCSLNLAELSNQQYSDHIVEVQNSNNSRSSSLNLVKQKPNNVEIANSTNSESSFLNHADLTCLQTSCNIEIENSGNSITNLLDHAKLTQQCSNKIVEVKDSPRFESSLLSSVKFTCHESSNDIVDVANSASFKFSPSNHCEPNCEQKPTSDLEIKNSDSSESNLSKHGKLACLQDANNIADIEHLASSESNSSYHVEHICLQNTKNNIKVQDIFSPKSSSSNKAELTCQQNVNDTVIVEESSSSTLNALNLAELTNQQIYNDIVEVQDSTCPESSLLNNAEFACQKNSSNSVEVKDSSCSESSSSNLTEIVCQQNPSNTVEVKNSSSFELSSLNHDELTYQRNFNKVVEVPDSADLESSSLKNTELTCRQNSNNSVEIGDSSDSELSSSNLTKIICQQNSSNTVENKNSSSFKLSSSNLVEHTNQQSYNDIVAVQDSACPSLSNNTEFTCQQNSNNTVEIEDSSSSELNSLNHDKLTHQQNFNNVVEVLDSASLESSSVNDTELICRLNSNNSVEVEDSSDSELSSSNHDELTYLQNFNNFEVPDSASLESSSLNNTESTCRLNSNNIVEVEDLSNSELSTSNHVELAYQLNSNNTVKVEDLSSFELSSQNHNELSSLQNFKNVNGVQGLASFKSNFSNHTEQVHQHNCNSNVDVQDSASPEPSSSSNTELACQQNSNNTDEFEDSFSSGVSSSNHVELDCQKNVNHNVDVQDSASPESSSSNNTEPACQQNSNNIIEVENSSSPESSSSNHDKLTNQQNHDNIFEIENAISPESISQLKNIKSILQKHSNDTVKVEDVTPYKSSSLHKTKLTYRQHPYKPIKPIETKISTSCTSTSLNHVKIACQPHSSEIPVVEYSISPRLELLNENTLACQQNSKNIVEVENVINKQSSALFDNCLHLPRVKFILKCHRKNMINTNIFDEESVVPLKKCNFLKDENFIAQHILKKNNKYKPWSNMYRKKSVDEPKEIIKEVVETICSQTINFDNIPQSTESQSFNDKEKENKVVSLEELPCSNEEKSIEKSNNVENEESFINTCNYIVDDLFTLNYLNTPMPSPIDDFQSGNLTPKHCSSEECWDKSLENEYKNVLRKTISKLKKNRVNIRSKFDIRLLSRKINVEKQKKWRRQCRQRRRLEKSRSINDNVSDIKVPTKVLTSNATTEKITTSPICKIKVQLPWGRIFNLNSSGVEDNQKTMDTKLELGPAKVEVRLSQTPGEWQVAACESMTSSKSVVSVRRLVLQRASPVKEDGSDICDSPSKGCNGDLNYSPLNHFDGGSENPARDSIDAGKNPENGYNSNCDSPKKYNEDSCHNCSKDFGNNCSTVSSSSKDDSSCSSSRNESDPKENSRKLPKIVIRRNVQDNNYTSYVSICGFEGDDNNDGTRQLVVRLVRDHKLDAMAVKGVTTVNLKHNVPISESDADTHGAKRVRYT